MRARFTFSAFTQQQIEANMQRAGNIVREMPNEKVLAVDLALQRCDCGHFQVERLPSRHIITYCANQCLDWQLYVKDVYKMTEVHKVYKFEFVPLGNLETWPAYPGPTLVANPAL
ncbi:hypothetical protein Ahy_B02g058469 [Arachis hypogaea]|uniref:Uncharacterized protein n=1 Tax=Arachis hypogaea TaxID=3818 RepID=A0A445AEQ3_ARAHY|nr:hypothetical protein Ahy_B02g058469 [Arachis hypogaea]